MPGPSSWPRLEISAWHHHSGTSRSSLEKRRDVGRRRPFFLRSQRIRGKHLGRVSAASRDSILFEISHEMLDAQREHCNGPGGSDISRGASLIDGDGIGGDDGPDTREWDIPSFSSEISRACFLLLFLPLCDDKLNEKCVFENRWIVNRISCDPN